ncbi:hypothetical protein B0A52_00772 [Exophiala mesophila]|uniref:C3H1-type domain-containing protein n=1 Tax=Exophiala mesophila TaxID=212818 RepID=A0A438NI58_EXOME|nr:hypothetical protein B0A52_00772 [Exophiala mesophila]
MVVCKFWQQGNCKFGDSCRFEHPGSNRSGGSNSNRFGALATGGGGRRDSSFGGGRGRNPDYIINPTEFRTELSEGKGRPNWILSAWGPKEGPASLLQSNEFSPEEIRLRFYELASQGKADEADREAIELWKKADSDMKNIAANAEAIGNVLREAEKAKPNRWDYLSFDGSKTRDQFDAEFKSQNSGGAFGSNAASSSSPFGSNTTTTPFGKPATSTFGQPSQPTAFGTGGSTFGQPSQPSAFGAGASTFGQPSQPTSSFGQPSTFGQPSQPTSSFGQASTSFGQSSFGQPSQPTSSFGRPSQPTSAFGQPSQPTSTFGQPTQTSSFGQPSQPTSSFGRPSAFGAATFGQAAQPASASNQSTAFKSGSFGSGAPTSFGSGTFGTGQSTFGQASQPTSAFGQPSQPTSAFGQPSQPTSSFGQPSQPASTFGQPSQPTSSFGQPSQPTSTFGQPTAVSSAFGKPSAFGQAGTGSSGTSFGQPSQPASFGQPSVPPTNAGFGSTPAQANPFGPRPDNNQPKDETMDAENEASAPSNSFGQPSTMMAGFGISTPVAPGQPAAQTSATQISLQQPSSQATLASGPGNTAWGNNSFEPHPLTGKPAAKVMYAQTLPPQKGQKGGFGGLSSFRGQPVKEVDGISCYQRPDGKGFEKIWFPNFAETDDIRILNAPTKIADTQAPAQEYTDEITQQFKHLFETGGFKDGKIPLVPPMRDWAVYDF